MQRSDGQTVRNQIYTFMDFLNFPHFLNSKKFFYSERNISACKSVLHI